MASTSHVPPSSSRPSSSALPFSLASSWSSFASLRGTSARSSTPTTATQQDQRRAGASGVSDAGADTDVDTIRLEDYLDDRLQSAADLFPSTVQSASQHGKDSEADAPVLTALLASVDVQRVQLERQLDEATRALAAAQNSGADRAREVAVRVQEFRELQVRVDARMKELRALIGEEGEAVDETKKVEAVGVDEDGLDAWGGGVDEEDGSGDIGGGPEVQDKTSRQASEAAVTTRRHLEQTIARLERPLAQLRRVRLTQAYLELLRDAEALRSEARQGTPSQTAADDSNKDARTRAAVAAYVRLRRLSRALAETAAGGGGGGPQAAHLVAYIESATATVWEELKTSMTGELRAVLEKRKWPTAIDPEKAGEEEGEAMDDEWRACCERLLELQMPELLASLDEGQGRGGGGSGGGGWKVTTLLPFDVMAQTFVDAFRYHFMSRDRPTGDPRAVGTYCFPWFLSLVERWAAFFRASMGPLLAEKFAGAGHAANMLVYMDPVCAFITSMLPVVREKVAAVMQEAALGDPAFLSSFMGQLMTFDETIRTRFDYDSGDAEKGWGGLTSEVLDKHFDAWLTAEKDFALARFREIRSSKEARNIDYEYNGPGKMKPTYGAVRVTDLLRSVTTQYERIRRFSHKLRFLIDIQIAILDEYHDLLRDSLEAYYSMTSAVGRTLHGVTKEQLAELEGTGALETLCKVIGSADHIINSLRDWSNEEFFVTLWERLQTRAKETRDRSNLAGGMSYEQVKDRTSSTIGSDDDGGILFDETITAFSNRKKAAQEFLVGALIDSHHKSFRPYVSKAQWTSISADTVDPSQLAISPGLDEPLRVLKRNLDFLVRVLSTAVFRRVWREALEKLQDILWSEVLMRQRFSMHGSAQFMRDVQAICGLLERYIPDGSSALASIQEAVTLLNLPLDVDEKEFSEREGRPMTLGEATDRMTTDYAIAKQTLEELGLETLTPYNARNILQRRIENSD